MDVFLLDERWNREELPCWTQREYCEAVIASGPSQNKYRWCTDLLLSGSALTGGGTCCDKDEKIFRGWCKEPSSRQHPLYAEACDVSSANFGSRMLVLDGIGGLREPNDNDPVDVYQSSPICEMLGRTQRAWFRQAIATSRAPVKLVASGSVVMANSLWQQRNVDGKPVAAYCSGDNWDCYDAAQQEFFHVVASASGCVIVLTGDYHWTEIKVLNNDNDKASYNVGRHTSLPDTGLIQVMSSGLTTSTSPNRTCEQFLAMGDFAHDPQKLRQGGECNVITGGSFASLHVQSKGSTLEALTVVMRDGRGNKVYAHEIDISKCRPVS